MLLQKDSWKARPVMSNWQEQKSQHSLNLGNVDFSHDYLDKMVQVFPIHRSNTPFQNLQGRQRLLSPPSRWSKGKNLLNTEFWIQNPHLLQIHLVCCSADAFSLSSLRRRMFPPLHITRKLSISSSALDLDLALLCFCSLKQQQSFAVINCRFVFNKITPALCLSAARESEVLLGTPSFGGLRSKLNQHAGKGGSWERG